MSKTYRLSAKGLRERAHDLRVAADLEAKKLERIADKLEAEDSHTWPQSGEVKAARR